MAANEEKPTRSWQEIAAEASQEKDPQKRAELAQELERALEERDARMGMRHKPAVAGPGKP